MHQTLLRNQNPAMSVHMRVRTEPLRKPREALRVCASAYSSVASVLKLGDDVTGAFECVRSQRLTKHLLTKEKLTSGAAGKVWYQECLGF